MFVLGSIGQSHNDLNYLLSDTFIKLIKHIDCSCVIFYVTKKLTITYMFNLTELSKDSKMNYGYGCLGA